MVSMMVNNILDKTAISMVRAITGLNGKINIVLDKQAIDWQTYKIIYESDYELASYYIRVEHTYNNTAHISLVAHNGNVLMEVGVHKYL